MTTCDKSISKLVRCGLDDGHEGWCMGGQPSTPASGYTYLKDGKPVMGMEGLGQVRICCGKCNKPLPVIALPPGQPWQCCPGGAVMETS